MSRRSDRSDPQFLQRLAQELAIAFGAEYVAIARVYESVLPPPVIRLLAAANRSGSERDLAAAGEALSRCHVEACASLSQGRSWSAGGGGERAVLTAQGWVGCAMAPVLVDGALWGAITVAHAGPARPNIAHDTAALEEVAAGLAKSMPATRHQPAQDEPFLSEAFNCVAEPLVVYDADLRVAWHNASWRKMMSYARPDQDVLGMPLVDIHRLNVEMGYWSPQRADEVFRDIASGRFSIERTTNIGATYMRHRNYPVGSGGFIGIRTDITDTVQRHHELIEARDRAEATSMAKSSFLANVSHELRTPLNAIIGFSEMMRRGIFGRLTNERYRGYADDIHRSGVLLQSLIDDLLDMARIEAGKIELRPEVLAADELIGDVLRLVDLRATSRDLKLSSELPPGLPAVIADKRATTQILLNIIGNAIKFTQRGGAIRIGAHTNDDSMLCIFVRDNGPGIDPRALPRLGRPFERADTEDFHITQENRGTGLGLAISRSLAESQGGSLRLHSELRVGTTVELLVPLAELIRAGD